MGGNKTIYVTDAAAEDIRTLASRWRLSASATIAKALEQATREEAAAAITESEGS